MNVEEIDSKKNKEIPVFSYPDFEVGEDGYTYYKKKIYNGKTVEYFSDGNVKNISSYKQGLLEGKQEFFHQNGELDGRVFFKEGEPHGPIETYHDNGKLNFKGFNKNGEQHGIWENYDDEGLGILVEITEYDMGVVKRVTESWESSETD